MKKKRIYLMIEIKKRELEARLYFAYIASLKGYSVVIANKGEIWLKRNFLRPGIVIFKSLGPNNTKLIDDIKKAGHEVVAWDEEAFVTPKEISFFVKKRILKENLLKLKYFFSWGEIEYEYLCKEFPEFKDNIIKTGNSRVDILKKKFSNVLDHEVNEIREKCGQFTLFLGNFPSINNFYYDDGECMSDVLHKQGTFKKGGKENNYVLRNEKSMKDVFRLLPDFFKKYSKKFPDNTLIIRPHPVEKIEPYVKMISGLKNIQIISDDRNALSWIKASDIMISSNCTTSVEAFLLERSNINFFVSKDLKDQEFYLPSIVSTNTNSVEETINLLENIYNKSFSNEFINNSDKIDIHYKNVKRALYNYDENICSVSEMLIHLDKINVNNNRDDKKINKIFFYYLFLRSHLGRLKRKISFIFKSKKDKRTEKYLRKKMIGFDFKEVTKKLKLIIQAGKKDKKNFKVKELIPKIFCVENIEK
tara:strand:- start:6278 stop:7705 length:1428 start_codon:yes stop_codon:yes gene_type:complete